MSTKQRLDLLLVERGLFESREQAQRHIQAGQVRVNGAPSTKPGHTFPADAMIAVAVRARFASRGGEKLEAALDHFAIQVGGLVCADIGASTGGFTDCLLQHGAARVYAVDVGRGQLHARLQQDPRVLRMEGCNARRLAPSDFPEPIAFATVDVSFISLTKVLPAVTQVLAPGSGLVTLIKPQFEAGRSEVGRGGVVRDAAVREAVVERVRSFGAGRCGLTWMGVCPSPILGPAGNVEFLAHWRKP